MIPDHGNPHTLPPKVQHPENFTCRHCSYRFSDEDAHHWVLWPWHCPHCKNYNTGTRAARGNGLSD